MSNQINLIQENQENSPSSINQNINNSEIPTSLTQEIQNENSKNNISDISTILKEIPLHNLNDYYSIETSVFKKRIEKLNLQFFWIYESILEGQSTNNPSNNNNNIDNDINSKQNLIFPYNKLFLILFKEISLYIEEIIRLNKQLNAKNKNEKFYTNKISEYKNKEKEFFVNKQIIKTLQRNLRNAEKNIEKLKKENEKLSKKLFNEKYSHFKNNNGIKNNVTNNINNKYGFHFSINNNVNNYRYSNFQKANTIYNEYYGFNNLTEQGSPTSSNSNLLSVRTYFNKNKDKEKSLNINKSPSKDSLSTFNKDISKLINNCNSCSKLYENNGNYVNVLDHNENDYDKKNLIYLSINQCQDEINNLNSIENLLMNCLQGEEKTLNREINKNLKKLMNTPINNLKYKINNRHKNSSSNKKLLFSDKKFKKMNKSLDFKNNIFTNGKKS